MFDICRSKLQKIDTHRVVAYPSYHLMVIAEVCQTIQKRFENKPQIERKLPSEINWSKLEYLVFRLIILRMTIELFELPNFL